MNQAPGPEYRGTKAWLAPFAGAVALVAAALALAFVVVALLLRAGGGQPVPTASPDQTHVAQAPSQGEVMRTGAPKPTGPATGAPKPTGPAPGAPEASGRSALEPGGTPAPTSTEPPAPSPASTPANTPTPLPGHTQTPTRSLTATGTALPAPTAPQAPVALLVWPYLGDTRTSSVVISWATEDPGASEVRYGLDAGLGTVVAASSNVYDGKHFHSATITGLAAGTTYHYRVYTAGQDLTPWRDATFATAPDPSSTAFAFAVLGDSRPWKQSQSPSQGALDVAGQLAEQDVDLVLHTGDIVHSGGKCSGKDSGWNQYLRGYFDLYRASAGRVPFYPSPGNHEFNGGKCGRQSYSDVFHLPGNAPVDAQEAYYSFDWANTHFVALDTTQQYRPGSTQYDWVVNDLRSTAKPWTIVYTHYPAYSSGHHGSTAPVLEHLVPVFEEQGVDVVFSGHDHAYERTCPVREGACTTPEAGGVVYFVTGGGGAAPYEVAGEWFTERAESIYHFLRVEVDGCRLAVEAVDAGGRVFDGYRLDRCGEWGVGSGGE